MSSRTPVTRSQARKGVSAVSAALTLPRQTSDYPKQTAILNVVGTLVIFIFVSIGYWKYHKSIIHVPKLNSIIDRLIYTLQLQTYSLIPLVLSLFQVMLARLSSGALNPLSGHEKHVEKPIRILTNTVEQLLFNFINLFIFVTLISADNLYIIPFIVFSFTIGRIVYFIGYNLHPKFRTYGFIFAFSATFLVFIFNLLYVSGVNKYLSLPAIEHAARKLDL